VLALLVAAPDGLNLSRGLAGLLLRLQLGGLAARCEAAPQRLDAERDGRGLLHQVRGRRLGALHAPAGRLLLLGIEDDALPVAVREAAPGDAEGLCRCDHRLLLVLLRVVGLHQLVPTLLRDLTPALVDGHAAQLAADEGEAVRSIRADLLIALGFEEGEPEAVHHTRAALGAQDGVQLRAGQHELVLLLVVRAVIRAIVLLALLILRKPLGGAGLGAAARAVLGQLLGALGREPVHQAGDVEAVRARQGGERRGELLKAAGALHFSLLVWVRVLKGRRRFASVLWEGDLYWAVLEGSNFKLSEDQQKDSLSSFIRADQKAFSFFLVSYVEEHCSFFGSFFFAFVLFGVWEWAFTST
jgi:hypothetical protein